ncbi:MAG TPA: phosphatase domain-containing protein, partial [Rubrobacteraceae bacterium]|nr:phosphatase domain-containing protein [Rubrobacteraceae bacterium]
MANAAEQRFDRIRFEAKRRLGLLDPFEVLPYRGYGTQRELFLRGRILEERGITGSGQHASVWDNLRNMARRFASDEVPGARVRVSFKGHEVETRADEEGFFDVRLELAEPLTGTSDWHPVELELLDPPSPRRGPVRSTGQVLVPADARFAVVSDIDDTVVRSSATNVLKMAWIVLLNNAHTRLPFEGVNAFYEALRRGAQGRVHNPI